MALTSKSIRGLAEEELRDSSGTGAQGAFPVGPGLPGDKTTGAGKGKRVVRKYSGRVAGTPSALTTGGGALGRTGGGV